ncbi:MAG: response regulator [Candidatus Heimdallarchaeota archaeon]|nr:response regulator [Candidatus Heimdallarchaeota archaeon]
MISKTVMIVDDESMIRNIVKKILNIKGHSCIEAESGVQAINLLKENTDIEFIILDLTMPGMSGEDTYYKIREFNNSVKVIISSGLVDTDLREKLYNDGVMKFLQKPFKMDELVASLQ